MKKAISLILAVLMLLTLAACNGTTPSPAAGDSSTASQADASSSADTGSSDTSDGEKPELNTVTPGKLTMSTDAGFAPYEYVEGEKVVGVDADIAQAIADYYGLELVIQDMDFTNALLAPQNGTADFAAAGISITEERLETMDFTMEYAESEQVILVRKGFADIKEEKDLANVKIGVQQSTTADLYCQDMEYANVSAYKKNLVAAEDLKNGQIDCMILDNMPAKAILQQNEAELEILDVVLFTDVYALAVKKGNTEMAEALNTVLKKLIDEGKIQEFTKTHMDASM